MVICQTKRVKQRLGILLQTYCLVKDREHYLKGFLVKGGLKYFKVKYFLCINPLFDDNSLLGIGDTVEE